MRSVITICFFVVAISGSEYIRADMLEGDTIDFALYLGSGIFDGPDTTTVETGDGDIIAIEAGASFPQFEINPENSFVSFDYVGLGIEYFADFSFRITEIDRPIESVSLSSFGATNLESTDISLVDNEIIINFQNRSFDDDVPTGFVVNLTAIPEPSTFGLVLCSLGLIASARCRVA
ncbi:MAG: hypothetical protein AAF456_16070 [Planctomycetota bacterium]